MNLDSSLTNSPTEIGTKEWIESFVKQESEIPEPDSSHVTVCDDGFKFMDSFNRKEEWKKVYLIKNSRGLGLRMPSSGFCTKDLLRIFGEDYVVDTIDVYNQETIPMSLRSFHTRFTSKNRKRLYNFLSLEFSNNEKMKELVSPPLLVYELSLVHKFWPDKSDPINYGPNVAKEMEVAEQFKMMRPDVALFCLCGMGGSYTDFHIDFGGSSVWYHIFKGKKVFYIAAPTDTNLRIYEEYQTMEKRSEIFLGNLLPKGELRRVVINEGETLMIPSGWIHAVYTPEDSLVFGGNFLHLLNIPMQLRVYDIERASGLEEKFLFPHFELVHWQAVRSILLAKTRESRIEGKPVSSTISKATQAILPYLKKWLDRDEKQSKMRDDELNGKKVVKQNKNKKRRAAGDSGRDEVSDKSKKPRLKKKAI